MSGPDPRRKMLAAERTKPGARFIQEAMTHGLPLALLIYLPTNEPWQWWAYVEPQKLGVAPQGSPMSQTENVRCPVRRFGTLY
jgi:hypothetical protein